MNFKFWKKNHTNHSENKNFSEMLNDYRTEQILLEKTRQDKILFNKKNFRDTIIPLLNDLIRFDSRFNYDFTEEFKVTVRFNMGKYLRIAEFYPDEYSIINGRDRESFSMPVILTSINYPDEKDRFLRYIKRFFPSAFTE